MPRLTDMRRTAGFAVLAALTVPFIFLPAARAVEPGDRAPDFALKDLRGGTVKLSSLRGKVVVLDFWASWCTPCKKELPALDALAQRWAKEGRKDIVVVAVNIDNDRSNAEKFLRAAKISASIRVLLDPGGSVAARYDLPTMPTSFVIDRKGIVRHVHAGYRAGDERRLAQEAESLLP